MPSSRPNTIPTVIHLVKQFQPKSILDVGIGFGKWGHLFREYTDINEAEKDPARYRRTSGCGFYRAIPCAIRRPWRRRCAGRMAS